jgi:hypothetical protein
MQDDTQPTESVGLQRRQGQCGKRSNVRGVPGFVLEHLELSDVRDVLDTCSIAQASNKMGKLFGRTIGKHAAQWMAEDKATRCDAKRLLTDQATNDGIADSQKLDRAWAITTS